MADIFNKKPVSIQTPITADQCNIVWDGTVVTSATNISVSYAQSVNRRHSIGNRDTIIFASQPQGQITISRLLTTNYKQLFGTPSWNGCAGGTLTFTLAGCNASTAGTFTASGCIVTQYGAQAEAEGLTVVDSVTIEFLQLELS